MTVAFDVTRPDDLLRLRFEARNMRVERAAATPARLVIDDASQPAFLCVHFPPQAIAESAFYEASILEEDLPPHVPPPPPEPIGALSPPGQVAARMARGSRLVFRVPQGVELPFTMAGLLDWSALTLNVNGIAAIGPNPTPAQIAAAPAIAAPADTETALELPYNLVISPTATVHWAHRLTPFTSRGRTELWHTRLQLQGADGPEELTPLRPAPLRAIWSENYSANQRPGPDAKDPGLDRTAMSPDDRHQIVVKTSAFRGYEREVTLRLAGFASRAPFRASVTAAPAETAALSRVLSPALNRIASPIAGRGIELTYWAPFVPQPFYADQVMLSTLGGWLRSRGTWDVIRKATPAFRFEPIDIGDILRRVTPLPRPPQPGPGTPPPRPNPPVPRPAALDALSPIPYIPIDVFRPQQEEGHLNLSEWVHVATQGRDHYVRIVYEGQLLPFGHRAALVKVTERKFRTHGSLVVAYLFQRNFIVVREPERAYAPADRGMPFKRVRLTTLVTPDIAEPMPVVPNSQSFWVEVQRSTTPGDTVRFSFHAVGRDPGTREIDFTIPMMFLSDAAPDPEAVVAVYNRSSSVAEMAARSAAVPGQKLYFAEPDATTDNTRLVTESLTFAVRGAGPRLLKARVLIPQVQELLGRDQPTDIRLYPGYIDGGFDAATGVFAEVVRDTPSATDPFAAVSPSTLPVGFSGDQAGGIATPNMGVSTLSRQLGPLAGTVADAVTDTFDPASFFPKGTAALFGTFDLSDLIGLTTLGEAAPKLQTRQETIDGVATLVTTLEWQPRVRNIPSPVAEFRTTGDPVLDVRGRIETPLPDPAAAGPPPMPNALVSGTLRDFEVEILKVVIVAFTEFTFVSRTGSKPDVTVKLDPASPLTFKGDLQFVEEIRQIVPPDLFGDGPSLDLSPTGIRAGFSFALPPVSVGVFALRDVSLGAALTLPFLDGRPTLDFNVSERPHPFLLSVGIFGGGGFFRLQLDTAGLKMVEAAFEFGATASIDLGVASGGVHIMAGIYFKLERKEPGTDLAPTLTGYLRMGGHLSVLGLIKVSLEFVLSFTYDGGRDKAYGRATLTVHVEIAFFSTSVEITVERAFGGSSGDPTFGQLFPAPATWSEYAEAFA